MPSPLSTTQSRRAFMRRALVGAAALSFLGKSAAESDTPIVRWTMPNVNSGKGQADSHILLMPDGAIVAVDFGFGGDSKHNPIEWLEQQNIRHLDALVISHYHRDHYGGITSLLDREITIGVLIHNPPTRPQCERESPWGCTWREISDLWSRLDGAGVVKRIPSAGDVIYRSRNAEVDTFIEVISAFDGLQTPVGPTDLNDMSIVCRLVHGSQTALFTGDLNAAVGAYLAAHPAAIAADILKVPHHGTEGTVPDAFFDQVNSRVALVSSPAELWASARSARVRQYFARRQIPVYVSGVHGQIQVVIDPSGFSISPEFSIKA